MDRVIGNRDSIRATRDLERGTFRGFGEDTDHGVVAPRLGADMTTGPAQHLIRHVPLGVPDHTGVDSCAWTDQSFTRSRFEGPRRILSLDMETLADLQRPMPKHDASDPIWSSIRQAIEIFPVPRHGNREAVAAGIARQQIECHAMTLFETEGVDEIIDRRLEADLGSIPAGPAAGDDEVISMETGWGPRRRPDGREARSRRPVTMLISAVTGLVLIGALLLLAKLESALALAGGATLAVLPLIQTRIQRTESHPPKPLPFGSETIKVGRGWIETASGRRRRRDDVVTTVFQESETDRRLEVRIIGPTRVVRLRFESIQDVRFVEFWRRWSGFQTDAISRRAG